MTGKGLAAVILSALLLVPAMAARAADCAMTLSAPQVDYGRLSRATMVVTARDELLLPPRTVALNVVCAEPADMTLFFHAASADSREFLFTQQGRLALRLRDGALDGETVELGQVDGKGGMPVHKGASLPWMPGWGLAPIRDGRVVAGRIFTAQMDIQARVEARAMHVNDTTRWSFTGLIEAAAAGAEHELSLQADVLAGSCQVDVTRHVSFGPIHANELDAHGASTHVPSNRNGQLRVTCDAPMLLAFRMPRDERAGTAAIPVGAVPRYAESHWFGLGKTPAGESIGAYALRWAVNASSDQGELHVTRSPDGGRSWSPGGGPLLAEHGGIQRVGYAATPGATTGPLPVTTLGVTLDAEIYIAPRHTLSLNEEIEADGLATFEIIY